MDEQVGREIRSCRWARISTPTERSTRVTSETFHPMCLQQLLWLPGIMRLDRSNWAAGPLWCLFLVLQFSASLPAQTRPETGTLPREQLPKSRAIDYDFDDVRIATILSWLRRVSVEPPVPLSGTVSGWLWAQAPERGWWRLGDYRVEGEITSPLLGVDRFAIREARVRFGYQQSLWTIGSAQGQIEATADDQTTTRLGQANLAATLPTDTQSNAQVNGQLSRVDLANLLRTFGLHENLPAGNAQATLRIDTKLANLSSPLTWNAGGQITISQLQYGQWQDLRAESDWTLNDAALGLNNTRLTLPGPGSPSLVASGSIQLHDNFAWQVQLPTQAVTLNQSLYTTLLPPAVPQANLPIGSIQVAGATSGTLVPWQAQYSLNLANGQLNWLGNSLANLNAQLSLTPSGLALDSLSFQTARGSLAGAALFSTRPDEPLQLNLSYEQIDLANLRAPIPLPVMTGRVTGRILLAADKSKLTDMKAIKLELAGTGQGVRIDDWGLGNIEYSAQKLADHENIDIHLQDAGGNRRWLADGAFTQTENKAWQYKIDARGNALDLSVPQLIRLIGADPQLPVPLEIVLVTGNVTLMGDTLKGLDTTEFNFSNITTLEREQRIWSQGSMAGRTTQQFIEVEQSRWQVAGSEIEAALRWYYLVQDQAVLDPTIVANKDYLRLRVQAFPIQTLEAWRLVQLPTAKDGRKPLSGLVSGSVDVQRTAGAVSWLTDWQGKVDLGLSELKLHGNDAGNVQIAGTLEPNQLDGKLTGELLKAPIAGDVKLTLQQTPTLAVSDATGQFSWSGGEINQLMGLWQAREQAAFWRGSANVKLQVDWHASGDKSGLAEIEVSQLAYRQRTIIRNLQAAAALDGDRVQLLRFNGGLGGGRVDVNGGLNLSSQLFEGLTVQLQRVSLAEVAQLVDPDWDQELTGRADVRARVYLEHGLDVHGDVRLHDAQWIGLPINELHSAFELTSPRDWSLIRLRTTNARGQVFGGRADVDFQARLGSRNAIDLRMRVDRGEVDQLSEWTGTSSVVGKGKFDAALTLTASDARSIRDLRGVLELSFEDTDARTLPVADQLTRFVPLFGLSSTEFENGKLSATISQGALRMRSLALWGRQLSVLGSGNVGMSNGRLDLQLVIRTGGGLSQQVAANYLAQLAATAVPQVELILQINRLVANRAVFLRVAGTASKPVIQPQAARMIEQALLRSLLEQAAILGPTTTALTTSK